MGDDPPNRSGRQYPCQKGAFQSRMRSILRVKRLCTEMDVFNAEWHKSQGSLRDRGALGLCSTPNGIRVRFRFAP